MIIIKNLNVLLDQELLGGQFNAIRVLAPLSVSGDLRCETLDIYHSGTFNGQVIAKTITVEGMASFNNVVDSGTMVIKGSSYFKNDLMVKQLTVHNEIKVANHTLHAETVLLQGMASIKKVDAYRIEIYDVIHADEIKANTVKCVDRVSGNINRIKGPFITISPNKQSLMINEIIGCNVELSNVHVKFVKAKQLSTGNNCQIDRIEYV